jgi:phenylacetic acid degradation operon negative regulatory protein
MTAATKYAEALERLDVSELPARSVIASALLGSGWRGQRVSVLIRLAGLFGIADGAARVALSRMVAAGEIQSESGRYRLAGRMLERQHRQNQSRWPATKVWQGSWSMAVVRPAPRDQATRQILRTAMETLRHAEYREGVWLRPNNLVMVHLESASAVVQEQCEHFEAFPDNAVGVAAALWDLSGWEMRARELRDTMAAIADDLEDGSIPALAPGFMMSAAVFRHVLADPLLPNELLPESWPGDSLRVEFERHDAAWQTVLRDWLRQAANPV